MKSYNDKKVLFGLLFLGLAAGFFGRGFEFIKISFPATHNLNTAAALLATEQNLAPTIKVEPVTTFGFVGDIMVDRGVKAKVNKYLGGDYAKLFANAGFLQEPDITFANLEGDVSTLGRDRHNLYSFHMDPAIIPALESAGVDVVSSANNHINDWGPTALADTLTRLRASKIATCGIGMNKTEAETPAILSRNGQTIGFLCFSDVGPNEAAATDTTPGILLASDPEFASIVKRASEKVNTLIVSFHFGVEYQAHPTARQKLLAQEAVDSGASLIVGAHPHVPEDISEYHGAPILYSLGNFIFDQEFSKETMHGLYVTASLKGKTFFDVLPHVTVLDKNFAPSLEK